MNKNGNNQPAPTWKPGDEVRIIESFLTFHTLHDLESSPKLMGAFAEPLIPDEVYQVLQVRNAIRRGELAQAVALRTVREIPFDGNEVIIKSGSFKGAAGTTGRLISPAWALASDLDTLGCRVEPMIVDDVGSFDEILSDMKARKERADARIKPWQRELKPGDHFLTYRDSAGLVTWGQIVDPLDGSPEEHYRAAFCACSEYPEGELAEIHLSEVWKKIPPAQFEVGRSAGFPNVASEIAAIVAREKFVADDGGVRHE